MVEHDKAQFAQMMIGTMQIYGKQPSEMVIQLYWSVLERFTIEQVEHGLKAHLNDPEQGKFQPKPADIIRHIEGTKADRKTLAEVAWRKVLDNVDRYSSVVFDDSAIHYAVQIAFGDWLTVCDFDKDQFDCQQMYRSFITAYSNYNGQPIKPRMVGILEQEQAKGESRFSVTYVGDKQKALQVEQGGRIGNNERIGAVVLEALKHDNFN